MPIAPFEAVVAVLDDKRDAQRELGERIWSALRAAGVDACLDDRVLSPGAKFKDLELLGFPVQIVVGEGIVEYAVRADRGKTPRAAVPLPSAPESRREGRIRSLPGPGTSARGERAACEQWLDAGLGGPARARFDALAAAPR
jgi:hypothetical protein